MDGRGERDLQYNRIGFCVLHPFRECAGRPYRAAPRTGRCRAGCPIWSGRRSSSDGVLRAAVPVGEPARDRRCRRPDGGFEFEGDLFEMEDQRNWTDASFKTYCTPLGSGIPHGLTAGQSSPSG